MRRLPIFLVADVSESMVGEALDELRDGIATNVSTLRKDPYALETAHKSIIAFAGRPRTLTPQTEMFAFHPPDLPVGGRTALGAALDHLMKEIDRNVATTTRDRKGDWKPLIFLLTDGAPTVKVSSAIKRWNRSYRARSNLIAVSIGGRADHAVLKHLTDEVIVFYDSARNAFSRFVSWISASIQSQIRSVGVGKDDKVSLAKPEEGVFSPLMDTGAAAASSGVDERFAVFLGRCSENQPHYIAKFECDIGEFETNYKAVANILRTKSYVLKTVVPVKDLFFEISEESDPGLSVKAGQLVGSSTCPIAARLSGWQFVSAARSTALAVTSPIPALGVDKPGSTGQQWTRLILDGDVDEWARHA